VPNRRRRRLSTATSAVVALAVASPVAVVAVSELSASAKAPQHREFVQAAMITDLPGELMSALSQGLSQFGINMPPMPTSLLTGSGSTTPPALTTPGLTTPGLTAPGASLSPLTATGPALTDPALANPALTNPALTNPALTSPTGTPPLGAVPPAPGLTTPGLTTPPAGAIDPALTPISAAGLPAPSEVPISAPIGLDPMAGTYPILGDPSLATMPASTGSGGLIGDLSSMANQLGAGQAIDLLKGMVMPAIMSAAKPPAAPAVPAPPAPPAAPIAHAAGTTEPGA
jgi:hypothetical protein